MKTQSQFRQGVCGVFISTSGKILLGERSKEKGQWQLPQGGIEEDESPLAALYREMQEEIGAVDIKIIRNTGKFISYLWPAGIFPKSKQVGQEHIYFLINGSDLDIETLMPTEEFSNFCWFTVEEVLAEVIEWKRSSYHQAFKILGLLR